MPVNYEILNTYPNPFNPSLNIDFFTDIYARVNISIYDILGNLVETLISDNMYIAGDHTINWEPTSNLSSGEYLVRFTINDVFITTKKVAYLK